MEDYRSVERELRGEIMRTDVFVRLVSGSRDERRMSRDLADVFVSFRDVEQRFGRFDPESELSRFNAGSNRRPSSEFRRLLADSFSYYRETEGLFDPAILPSLESEGYVGSFGTEAFGIPGERGAVAPFRFGDIVLREDGEVRVPDGIRIDFGGIAKGYAVDRAACLLRERGYTDFLIDAGGDMFAAGGDAEKGNPYWAIDVADPVGRSGSAALLILSDRAVATSGTDRRRWTTVDGRVRHHLIDPRTGKSAETDIVSATVVAESVVRAETFAKSLCILGSSEAEPFARRHALPMFLVTDDGRTMYNDLMKPYVYAETDEK
ncbi:MAG: FAD:protein FMN transferase [Candidatus Moranbacteria bacterium]|nr:FAD:protein FMN transferase [Candidatus Moranbacteria bacterium]